MSKSEKILGISVVLIVMLAALTFVPGLAQASREILGTSSWGGAINRHLNPFRTRHAMYQTGLPVYDLKIDTGEFRRIESLVDEAKSRGRLTDDLKLWSKAQFIHDGTVRRVKLRVRGDGAEHWAQTRRSWRIRFPQDAPLDGQREINLIVTTDGKGITEAFTNAVFRTLGLITLRDRYCILRINGVPQGVYYQTEHWDAPLLVHHQRPETTIFRNPGGGWESGSFREQITDGNNVAWEALEALLDYERDPTPTRLQSALNITDLDDYLKFLAGTTLFCADHTSLVTDNHRLYYDTSRGLFYRIPWDLEPQRIPTIERFDLADWHATFDVFARWPMSKMQIAVLQDRTLRTKRNRILWNLVRDDQLLRLFDQTYHNIDFAFWSDVQSRGDEENRLTTFRNLVAHNAKLIRKSLSRNQAEWTLRDAQNEPDTTALRLTVNSAAGVSLRGMILTEMEPRTVIELYKDLDENSRIDDLEPLIASTTADSNGSAHLTTPDELILPEMTLAEDYPAYIYDPGDSEYRYRAKPLRTVLFPKTGHANYLLRGGSEKSGHQPSRDREGAVFPRPHITLDLANAATDETYRPNELQIRTYHAADSINPLERTRDLGEFLAEYTVFQRVPDDGTSQTIVLRPGNHKLDKTIVIPRDTTLHIEPGTRIKMSARASLIVFGPILAEGTEAAPIEIVASDGKPWGVFASVKPNSPCVFKHVHVSGGNTVDGITVQGITFTGALAVHQGDVIMDHCRITNNSAEDGVNIKNGNVTITNCYFADNASDAMDLDFVTGTVIGCHFDRNAGDALDFSGSRADIEHCRMENSVDKGISVGEQSDVSITDCLIQNNAVGIAVKDLSNARIEHCTFLGNHQFLAAYRKKAVFGGGQVEVRASILADIGEGPSVDGWSSITFSDCLSSMGVHPPGCSFFSKDGVDRLRSDGFVANIDPAQSRGPGILAQPVDLQ
ncbi:MAG: CotH kinase family protein [Planctomycetota bacterium]